ncbi:MAG: hypothetical protein COB23_00555 [Methylophaga sp.]|nr:MAG: hypothetical protein COB23_00555 [Methylophaga sp.]
MKSKYILVVLCITLLITACSSVGPTIRSNFNSSVDFNQYKTFGFFQKLDTDYRYESLTSQFLKDATIVEMTKRGFTFTKDAPDVLINFHNTVESKQDVRQRPTVSYGRSYRYHKRIYYDARIGYETYTHNYKKGTLSIDMVDRQQNKVIWEGVAEERLTKEELKNLQSTLQKSVAEIFAQFPISTTP